MIGAVRQRTPGRLYRSALLAEADQTATGSGGNITVETRRLIIRDGGTISASTSTQGPLGYLNQGSAGNVSVTASESVELSGISPNAEPVAVFRNFDDTASGFSSLRTQTGGTGDAGELRIETRQLNIRDRAQVSAGSTWSGDAGKLEVVARSIHLDNQGQIIANTTAGEGNVILLSGDLVLRRGSNITTNATGTASGGNITIDTGVIAALRDSDISANSANSLGGRIAINTQGIFGTEFRDQLSPLSDITATGGRPELSGKVEINNIDVDPSQGLIELPAELVDASNQIAQGCSADIRSGETKFIITGRGGLPPNPNEPLTGDNVLTEWNTLDSDTKNRSSAEEGATNPTTVNTPTTIVEANGWMTNDKGEVVLIATAPTATLNIPWLSDSECNAPKQKS